MTEESKIQKKIMIFLATKGYKCLKIISANENGIPDLLAYHRKERNIWIEVKTETGILSPIQKQREIQLKEMGQRVIVPYGYNDFLTKYKEICH